MSDKNIRSSLKPKLSHRKQTVEIWKTNSSNSRNVSCENLDFIISSLERPALREFSWHAILSAVTLLRVPWKIACQALVYKYLYFQSLNAVQVLESLDQTLCSRWQRDTCYKRKEEPPLQRFTENKIRRRNYYWILQYHISGSNVYNHCLFFYRCIVHYWIYILLTHQQMHLYSTGRKFKFILKYT